jgi:hypothetical protein
MKAILARILSGISLNFVLQDYEQIRQQSRTVPKYPRIIISEFKSTNGKAHSTMGFTELLKVALIFIIPKHSLSL